MYTNISNNKGQFRKKKRKLLTDQLLVTAKKLRIIYSYSRNAIKKPIAPHRFNKPFHLSVRKPQEVNARKKSKKKKIDPIPQTHSHNIVTSDDPTPLAIT